MRSVSLLVAGICLLPMLLVLSAWFIPLAPESAANWQHVTHTVLADYAFATFALAAGVAVLTGFAGVSTAWLIATCEFPFRRVLSWLLIMPFAVPSYIMAMSYGTLFEFAGPVQTALRETFGWGRGSYWFPQIRSLSGAIFLLSLSALPYVYMMARLAFASQSAEWFDMAQSVGKTRRQLFWQVALPAARPFIVIGLALAVMETIAEIGAVQMLGVSPLSTGIYRTWFYLQEPLVAARIASFLLLIAAAILWAERVSRRGARYDTLRTTHPRPRRRLKPVKAACVSLYCGWFVLMGFALPVAWLIRLNLHHAEVFAWGALTRAVMDSLTLAALGTLLVVACAFIMTLAERAGKSIVTHTNVAATLGYAMPGVVIAVGLMLVQGYVKDASGIRALMTGTFAGLMIAYLIRFLSPAYSALHGGYQRISPQMDMAAASLGASRAKLAWRVHMPMLRLPALTAALIVAIDVLKELPATLILRPFDVRPLAIAVYEFAGDDRPVEAAPYALALVLICTLAVAALHRLQERQHG